MQTQLNSVSWKGSLAPRLVKNKLSYFMSGVVFGALPALNLFFSGADIPCSQGWQPPGWLFGVVWTMLSISTGGSGALLLQARDNLATTSFAFLCFLLGPGWATSTRMCNGIVTLLAVYATLACTIFLFLRLRTIATEAKDGRPQANVASWLLLPLLCWLGFATFLSGNSLRLEFSK